MKLTQALQGWKKYYLKRQIPQSRPQKPLKLSHELVQTLWQDLCRAAGSDKSQATAVLLMQRKEIHQGPVITCPGQICAETGLSDRDWTLAMTPAGCWREPGIVLWMEISWGKFEK